MSATLSWSKYNSQEGTQYFPLVNCCKLYDRQELLQGNPGKGMPWFVMSKLILMPLCNDGEHSQMKAYHLPSGHNWSTLFTDDKALETAAKVAKSAWA
eukprot:7701861-Ditylum_brightwellii.AAC.1